MSMVNLSAQCQICKEFFKFVSGLNSLEFHVAFAQWDITHDKCEKVALAMKKEQESKKDQANADKPAES